MDAKTKPPTMAPMPASAAAAEPPPRKLLPLGIHFGLPEEQHHDDEGLGSTSVKLLRRNPTSYWQNSHMNPGRVDKRTRARDRGHGMHKLLLEGEAKFDALFMRGPTHQEDMTPAEKGALTKAANAKAAAAGMVALPAADYDRIIIAHSVIKKNPDMATAFSNGFGEVSIFWERDGVRRKARIDYLKIAGIGDLKGTANQYDIDFEEACRLAIARYRYDIQAAHYLEARSMIAKMVANGSVYGDHDATLLKKIAGRPGTGWQWVFYCTEGTPDAFSYRLVHGNPMIEVAQRDVEIAMARYVRFKQQFGNEQWILIKPPQDLTLEMMPAYFARMSPEESDEYSEWMRTKGK